MPKKSKKTEETIVEDVPEPQIPTTKKDDEAIDILDYLNEPNLRLGVDYREKIEFKLDGRKVSGVIRPLSSDEVANAQTTADMGQGAVDKIVVSIAFFGANGKPVPMLALDKFPAGVTNFIATKIMNLSGYNLDEEATEYLKKP